MLKLLRVENYIGYVKDRAYSNWLMLPQQVKSWLGLDDFVNEGLIFVRFHVMLKYDPGRNVQFATLLYKSVDRYFKLRRVALCRRSRLVPGVLLPIGKSIGPGGEEQDIDVPAKTYNLEYALYGEAGLLKVYKTASPLLKKQMSSWFFSKGGTKKIRRRSMLFRKAKKEFKKLAAVEGLSYELCKAYLDRRREEGYVAKVRKAR